MKNLVAAVLFFAAPAFSQPDFPIRIGPAINFIPPAADATGRTVVWASSVTPQGMVQNGSDLYAGTVKLASSVTSLTLTSDGSRAVFITAADNGGEAVGMVDTSTGVLRKLTVDTKGCIQPLAVCIGCVFSCVVTPHTTSDGGQVLYAVRRNQPFVVVNADGTGLTQLPVYTGALAAAAQRVISANGQVVFTSSAPFGPTFAASATDVYLMNLDGTNIRNLTNFGGNGEIYASNATISQDGNTIVFETNYAGRGVAPALETQIWAVQSDGSRLRQLTFGPGAATGPSISANGQMGVFIQAGLLSILQPFIDVQPAGLRFSIAVMQFSVPQSPAISDDGQRVAFLVGPSSFSAGAVYQVDTNGSGLRALYAPRAISPRGVVSAAGSAAAPSPGGLLSVYGINFAGDSMVSAREFPLPDTLGSASVLLNGTRIPMLTVSPWQINAQLPQQAPAQDANVQVAFADGVVTPAEVTGIVTAAPALFETQLQRGSSTVSQAAVFHAGTAIPADDDHPAQAGEVLEMYGTGLGVTDPAVEGGQASPANPPARAIVTPVVLVGNVMARVLFAGLTPGFAGLYQVNIVAPGGLKAGRYSVTLKSGDTNTGGLGTIAIK